MKLMTYIRELDHQIDLTYLYENREQNKKKKKKQTKTLNIAFADYWLS